MINPALLDGVSANFIVKGPSGVEKSYPMRQITMTVGRSDQCDISVKDGSMSGRHCEVQKISGEIRVKDLGSANGIWLNGERITDAELYDGDVIRCGQTSIRVDVVGGRKRPDAGLSPKLLGALIGGFVLLAIIGTVVGLQLKKRAQKKRDLATVSAFVAAARESQKSKPCAAVVDKVADVARLLNTLPRVSCANPPRGEEAKKVVGTYRELARTYDRIATSIAQFSGSQTGTAAALTGSAEQIADPDLKAKVAEAQEAIEARSQVTHSFISDWKKLQGATSSFAAQADAVLEQGNKALCPNLERGVQAKGATEILASCNKGFEKAKVGVEDKLKDLDELAGGGDASAQ
jgi:hypothetical protein